MRWRTLVLLLLLLVLAIPVVGLVGLWAIDAGYWRGAISRHVEAATGRRLEMTGPLTIDWGMQTTIALEGLKLANASWAAAPTMLDVPRLELQARLLSLLGGRPEIERLSVIRPILELETAADGRQSWNLATLPTPGDEAASAIVREVTIENGTIRYLGAGSGQVTTIKVARGVLTGDATGDSAAIDVNGELEGVAAGLSGRLAQSSAVLLGSLSKAALTDLKARLGDNELVGTATVNWAGERVHLRADLSGERVDPAPFLALRGDPQGTTEKPDASSTLDGLTALDADVRLRAGVLVLQELEFTKVETEAKLDAGRLEISPLRLELDGRPVTGSLLLDGGRQPNEASFNAAADSLPVGRVLAGLGLPALIEGPADVRAELRGHGASPKEWAATADGHVRLIMAGGRMGDQLVDQLAGGLRQLAGSLVGHEAGKASAIRCVVLDAPFVAGVAKPDMILQTDYTTLIAHGTVDLRRDRVDITLTPAAKSVDLNVALPVTIRGPLDNPSYGIDETDAARRLVSLLGSAIFPPAALGAFVDFGSAKGNDCLTTAASPPPKGNAAPAPAESLGQQIEGAAKRLLDQVLPAD